MSKKDAHKQLNTGYIILIAGSLTGGLSLSKNGLDNGLNGFLFGYIFWSIYWGYKIAYNKISIKFLRFFNTPVHIEAKGTKDFFSKSIAYIVTVEFIKFWGCYFIGALGGAIIKQVTLSRIAYFKQTD